MADEILYLAILTGACFDLSKFLFELCSFHLGMVAHTCYLSTQEGEVEGIQTIAWSAKQDHIYKKKMTFYFLIMFKNSLLASILSLY